MMRLLSLFKEQGPTAHELLELALPLVARQWRPLLIDLWMHLYGLEAFEVAGETNAEEAA